MNTSVIPLKIAKIWYSKEHDSLFELKVFSTVKKNVSMTFQEIKLPSYFLCTTVKISSLRSFETSFNSSFVRKSFKISFNSSFVIQSLVEATAENRNKNDNVLKICGKDAISS